MSTEIRKHVAGFVAPGFESVRDVLMRRPQPWGRGGGGVSAYVRGQRVVDLWGGQRAPGLPWQEDTLAPIASITKGWAACVVHRLVEQEVLDFTTPICAWWPEFAAHGKHTITLREVFLHSSGVLGFDGQHELLDGGGMGQGWGDYDAIAAGLAAARPVWAPGSKHGYHALTFGWLVQEVVRRTTGRTVGDLFRTDFAEPLGLDSHLGALDGAVDRVARCLAPDLSAVPAWQRWLLGHAAKHVADPNTLAGTAFLGDGRSSILERAPDYLATPAWLEAEVPASNGVTTAGSLAKLFAALAAGGSLEGVRVLRPESVALMHQAQVRITDVVSAGALPAAVRWAAPKATAAYGCMPNVKPKGRSVLGPNPETFACGGFGGQLVLADPVAQISLASTCTDFTPGLDKVIPELRQALYEAAGTSRD
ncbi:MAG: beta-lactamase family protein [Actinomycetota bacterium]|nr:beta-lactamase family protein [Actinomycetota bacterium]